MDEVVVSGVSGRFPESKNVEEFWKNLVNGTDMVTEDDRRWKPGLWGLPKRNGKLIEVDKFDATFFGVHAKQANNMDPQLRMLMETTYEAIYDAGINPENLRGSNTGVWVGVSGGEAKETFGKDPEKLEGYVMTGCCAAMFANRLSFFFDFKGPSLAVDTACSSSLLAFQMACDAVASNKCEGAIVAGANLVLKPQTSLQFQKLNMLSKNGQCRSFDADGNGYVRSETIAAVYITKKSVAKRSYCSVLCAKTNTDGHKDKGVTFPSGAMQQKLLESCYKENNIDPFTVVYMEAHGTGTKVGDPQEINAITKVFCNKRDSPLLIGSVKSNMGHPEPASGVAALIKCVLTSQNKIIPPNLHFNKPNPEIQGLTNGELKVVTEPTTLPEGLIAINSFGFGGSNVHVILKPNEAKDFNLKIEIPQLICVCDRSLDGITETFKYFDKNPDALTATDFFNNVSGIRNLESRGFYITKNSHDIDVPHTGQAMSSSYDKPVWYICSGMGTQWKGMGKDLMSLDIFKNSIKNCSKALSHTDIEVEKLLTCADKDTFESTINSFVGMASIQIGLIDILKSIGIEPDGLIGHSVGELACGYADGSLSLEQTVQAAYCRGKCISDASLKGGAMAAVGLSWEECHELCPEGVTPACHNSHDSVTISGNADSVKKFVEELKQKKVFAKEVKTAGVAFHSKAMESVYPVFVDELKKIIPHPQYRSKRWISTSVLEESWDNYECGLCSAEYHANNLLSPVLFQEALQHVPENAIVIEIAPHGLLQAILRRSLPKTCTLTALTKRNTSSEIGVLLSGLGKLYLAGCNLNLSSLNNNKNSYPVPNGTMMLSNLLHWDHSQSWNVPTAESFISGTSESQHNILKSYNIDIKKSSPYEYMSGHCIDGRVLLPAIGYLYFVWRTLADSLQMEVNDCSVVFEDVTFHRATVLHETDSVSLEIQIITTTKEFRISESNGIVVSGKIYHLPGDTTKSLSISISEAPKPNGKKLLDKCEVYKILQLRGYNYKKEFQAISSMHQRGDHCTINWSGNWVPFLDAMLQVQVLEDTDQSLKLPTRIRKLTIFPQNLLPPSDVKEKSLADVAVYFDRYQGTIVASNAVEIIGLHATSAPKRPLLHHAVLEGCQFFPFFQSCGLHQQINSILHLAIENLRCKNKQIKVLNCLEYFIPEISGTLMSMPLVDILHVATNSAYKEIAEKVCDFNILEEKVKISYDVKDSHLVIVDMKNLDEPAWNLALENISGCISTEKGFILCNITSSILINNKIKDLLDLKNLCLISSIIIEKDSWILCRKISNVNPINCKVIPIDDEQFVWIEKVKTEIKSTSQRIWIVSNQPNSGILGFIKCLQLEPGYDKIRCIFDKSSHLDLSNHFEDLCKKDLLYNVYQDEKWGSYCHIPLNDIETNKKITKKGYIKTVTKGDLSSLSWFCLQKKHETDMTNKEEFKVAFAALNFRDIMLASGKLSNDAIPGDKSKYNTLLGMEFSGWDKYGKRVMGLLSAEGLATHVYTTSDFIWKVPDKWSLENASTVPVVYATAYYSLVVRGNIKAGESVLIHSGSGGVGQAAITIAFAYGCTVFTTVSTQEKRDYLKQKFPKLTDISFANSRDTTFESHIMTVTKGKGVDVVLNSLSGEKLQASVRCVAKHGRFLEIGKYDLSNNSQLGMSIFLKNISFHGILLDSLFDDGNEDWLHVKQLVQDGIETGVVQPLSAVSYDSEKVEDAFRFMSQGKHIGKVLLQMSENQQDTNKISAISQTTFSSKKSYLVTGGLGGFGLEFISWMIDQGARIIIITSRTGIKTAYQQLKLTQWSRKGASVTISKLNIVLEEETEQLVKLCEERSTLGGVFHLAVVLNDALFANQTPDTFSRVCDAKCKGIQNLDRYTKKYSPELDHFVAFSSIASGRGNAGQTNYGFANSFMERVCEMRHQSGLPGLAIQWGPIGDVGVLINTLGNRSVGGALVQPIESCLNVMDKFLVRINHSVISSFVPEIKESINRLKSCNKTKTLVDVVAHIMGINDQSSINNSTTLGNLGLDSLMGVEIQQTLEREFNTQLEIDSIRTLTFDKLRSMSSNQQDVKDEITQLSDSCETVNIRKRALEFGIKFINTKEVCSTQQALEIMKKSDSKKDVWFFVHPIEGSCLPLKDLAKQVKGSVYGLNCTISPIASIQQLASHYITEIKKIKQDGSFNLVGYSFGACVAFEMALQLQKQNEDFKLFMLDSSHSYVSSRIQFYAGALDDLRHKESAAFSAFLKQINPNVSISLLQEKLNCLSSENSRLDAVINVIFSWFSDVERNSIFTAAKRYLELLKAAYDYKPKEKYTRDVVLIKSTDQLSSGDSFSHDYGLSSVCVKTVVVHTINSDHTNLVKGENAKLIVKIMQV